MVGNKRRSFFKRVTVQRSDARLIYISIFKKKTVNSGRLKGNPYRKEMLNTVYKKY